MHVQTTHRRRDEHRDNHRRSEEYMSIEHNGKQNTENEKISEQRIQMKGPEEEDQTASGSIVPIFETHINDSGQDVRVLKSHSGINGMELLTF